MFMQGIGGKEDTELSEET